MLIASFRGSPDSKRDIDTFKERAEAAGIKRALFLIVIFAHGKQTPGEQNPKNLPGEICDLTGEEIVSKLFSHQDQLVSKVIYIPSKDRFGATDAFLSVASTHQGVYSSHDVLAYYGRQDDLITKGQNSKSSPGLQMLAKLTNSLKKAASSTGEGNEIG